MAPDDPEPVWFFTKDGERQGPASTAEMRQIALHGAMDDALVWREGLDDWQQLSNFPELLPAGQTGRAKRKREGPSSIPAELPNWLEALDEDVLAKFFVMACDVPEILQGLEPVRDRLLQSYMERDPGLEGSPEDYRTSDEMFFDVMDMMSPREVWKMLYQGNEADLRSLLANAARYSSSLLQSITVAHKFTKMKKAIQEGDLDEVMTMVDEDPGMMAAVDPKGRTALYLAVKSSQEAIARALLVQNSDYEQGDGMQMMLDIDFADTKGNTPLHLAAEAGDIEMAALLLDFGADPNLQNDSGEYGDGNWSVRAESGKELRPVSEMDKTPLHIACEQDDKEMVSLLLERGAEPDIPDKAGMTSLHHAVEEDSEAVVAVLIEYGADPTLGNNIIGMDNTPLHAAISKGQTRIAKLLLETGQFDVNKPGAGWLPLHLAARRGMAKAVQMLLDAGADPSATDGNGRTAKDLAEINKREECVRLLDEAIKKADASGS